MNIPGCVHPRHCSLDRSVGGVPLTYVALVKITLLALALASAVASTGKTPLLSWPRQEGIVKRISIAHDRLRLSNFASPASATR